MLTPYATFERRHPEFIKHYKQSRSRWRNQMQLLAALDRRNQHSRVRRLLRDRRFHSMFAFRALIATKRLHPASPETVAALAQRFDAFSPVLGERVEVIEIETGSGIRAVQKFGPIRRMHQMMVADILKSLHPPPLNQKLFNGGMPMVRRAIEAAYHEGRTACMEVDIVNFYGSVNPDGLADLMRPLPTNVVENVVWDMSMRVHDVSFLSAPCMYPTSSVRPGLALGSATSSIVGEIIIARVLAAALLTDMVTYADNILLQGGSRDEVEAMHERLRDHLARAFSDHAGSYPQVSTPAIKGATRRRAPPE